METSKVRKQEEEEERLRDGSEILKEPPERQNHKWHLDIFIW